ncbi:MAG: hypothetical protein ACFNKL_09345 [Treponema sp.]
MGLIKNRLCNFALCKIAADGEAIMSFISNFSVRRSLENRLRLAAKTII